LDEFEEYERESRDRRTIVDFIDAVDTFDELLGNLVERDFIENVRLNGLQMKA